MFNGWPLWLQYYTVVGVFMFGLFLAVPDTPGKEVGKVVNFVMSLLFAVIWPIMALMIVGACAADWAKDR